MILEFSSADRDKKYAPVPIGNGDLSCFVDFTGGQLPENEGFGRTLQLWRAGRRFRFTRNREMISFGRFFDQLPTVVNSWRQTLDTERALVKCQTIYGTETVDSLLYIHALSPMLCIEKWFTGSEHTFCYSFSADSDGNPSPFLQIDIEKRKQQLFFHYRSVDGSESGCVSLCCDRPFRHIINGVTAKLLVSESPVCFTLYWHDEHDPAEILPEDESSHLAAWQDFYTEGGVSLPGKIGEAYNAALYHLRLSSTRWTIPAGGIDGRKWHSGYYPYDAYFAFLGLLSGGHLAAAKRTPEFYHEILPAAQLRSYTHWGKEKDAPFGADYAWVNDEVGTECANDGFWNEHIFHMAHIALSGWTYYEYSGDLLFLRNIVLPVMKNCCRFYQTRSIISSSNETYLGKCTDMERLGPGRERAFQTTCAVIWCLEKCADACQRCNTDVETQVEVRTLSQKLRASFAIHSGRYLPYAGGCEESVAMLAGQFPFRVLSPDDPLWRAAVENLFCSGQNVAGNMYPIGKGECAWYLAWKSLAAGRMGNRELADYFLNELVNNTQSFCAIFEIVEPVMCPWFCTAEGLFLHAVHERLFSFSSHRIEVLPFPAPDYSFTLPAENGILLHYRSSNHETQTLELSAPNGFHGVLVLPEGREIQIELSANERFQL